MWYHYFFYMQYKYYSESKWKEDAAPALFSSVIFISVLQMLNFLTIRDLIIFHIQKNSYRYFESETFIIPTIFLIFNYTYFKYNYRYKKIIKKFKKEQKNDHNLYRIVSWVYIILTVIFVIIMGYSVKNNIQWW